MKLLAPPEVYDAILERLAGGESLRQICHSDGFPSPQTVLRRVLGEPAFAEQYAHARELGRQMMADDIQALADMARQGLILKRKLIANNEIERSEEVRDMVDRCRLQIDARKWLLSKLEPKKYGDRVQVANDPDNPLNVAPIVITIQGVDPIQDA